jgi:hypothetical protein
MEPFQIKLWDGAISIYTNQRNHFKFKWKNHFQFKYVKEPL